MLRKIDEGIAVIKPMAWKGRGGPEKLNPSPNNGLKIFNLVWSNPTIEN